MPGGDCAPLNGYPPTVTPSFHPLELMPNPRLQELDRDLQAERSHIRRVLLVAFRGNVLLHASWHDLQQTAITETVLELASSPIRGNVSYSLAVRSKADPVPLVRGDENCRGPNVYDYPPALNPVSRIHSGHFTPQELNERQGAWAIEGRLPALAKLRRRQEPSRVLLPQFSTRGPPPRAPRTYRFRKRFSSVSLKLIFEAFVYILIL